MIWSILSAWSNTYYTFIARIELPGNGMIAPKKLKVHNLFLYKDKVDEGKTSSTVEQKEIILHTVLLIHCILYFAKILFELSLGISKITNVLDLMNLSALFVLVIIKYIDIIYKN